MTKKTERFNMVVDPSIKKLWQTAANRAGYESVSEWIRLVLTLESRKVLKLTK